MKKNKLKNKKNNLLITLDYCPLGGIGISNVTLKAAKALTKYGWNITLASTDETSKSTTLDNIKIKKLSNLDELVDIISQSDIVVSICNFSNSTRMLSLGTADISLELGKPFIPWLRTTYTNSLFTGPGGFGDFSQEIFNKMLIKTLEQSNCKKIVCVSNVAKESLMAFRVPEKNIVVIYNGIDIKENVYSDCVSEKSYDVIFTGRLSPEKGLLFFLSALKLVKNNFPNIKSCIIGNGPEKNNVKNWIRVLNLENNVELIEKLENSKVLMAMKNSKVYVNTSFTESFGNTILEAMAVGTPVVVPNIEGPKELTQNGLYGEVYEQGNTKELADKICKCILGKKETLRKTEKAKNKVLGEFTIDIQAEKLNNVLRNSLK